MAQVTVDDIDPRVIHRGNWVHGGTIHENDNTVSSTTTPGDSLSLTFTGTAISVYGTIDDTSAGVTSTYTVDGGTPNTVVSVAGQGDAYRQLFWSSGPISNQQHTLVVTVTKVNSAAGPNEGTIWFDYFLYNTTSQSTTTSPAGPFVTSSNGNSEAAKLNIGAVVGGVIAGLLVLSFLIVLLIWRCWLRRKPRKSFIVDELTQQPLLPDGSVSVLAQAPLVQPYPTSFAFPPSTTGPLTQTVAPSSGSTYHAHNVSISTLHSTFSPAMTSAEGVGPASVMSSIPGSSTPGTSTPQLAPSRSTAKRRDRLVVLTYDENDHPGEDAGPPPIVTQHVDSGLRAGSIDSAGPGPGVIELPPVYSLT